MFDHTKKRTIVQWLHFDEVAIDGPIGGGPHHLIPMALDVMANDVRHDEASFGWRYHKIESFIGMNLIDHYASKGRH